MPSYRLKIKFSGAAVLTFTPGFVPGKVARYFIAEKVQDALNKGMLACPPEGLPPQTKGARFYLDVETGVLEDIKPRKKKTKG